MKTLQQKRLDFLNETVNHYNINNRCAITKDGNNTCKYSPKTLGLEGISEGCAIGRHLTKKQAMLFDGKEYHCPTVDSVFEELPKKLQIYGEHFLMSVQGLHDDSDFWNETGLNKEGEKRYHHIVEKYCYGAEGRRGIKVCF